jgi:hypothetical protein
MKVKYTINGKEVTKAQFSNLPSKPGAPMVANTYRHHDPLISESMGVLPNQIDKERSDLRRWQEKGELTEVSIRDDGSVALEGRGEQGRVGWMRYRGGKQDADGGYGDTYTPNDKFGDGD